MIQGVVDTDTHTIRIWDDDKRTRGISGPSILTFEDRETLKKFALSLYTRSIDAYIAADKKEEKEYEETRNQGRQDG